MVRGNATFTLVAASQERGYLVMTELYRLINEHFTTVEFAVGFRPHADGVDLDVEAWVPDQECLTQFGGLLMQALKQFFGGEVTVQVR